MLVIMNRWNPQNFFKVINFQELLTQLFLKLAITKHKMSFTLTSSSENYSLTLLPLELTKFIQMAYSSCWQNIFILLLCDFSRIAWL